MCPPLQPLAARLMQLNYVRTPCAHCLIKTDVAISLYNMPSLQAANSQSKRLSVLQRVGSR
jgi:hypothetical protein